MTFLDSLLYSFSNIFSIGPDMYDDDCCGGAGPGGTCCKNIKPLSTDIGTSSSTVLSCQQKQELYACQCSDQEDKPTIKIVICGQQLPSISTSYSQLALLENHLKSIEYNVCTVTLDQQCQDLLFTLPICVFILSDTRKDNTMLDRLMGWMNEQILLTNQKPLRHLLYAIILFGQDSQQELAEIFQQKLDQLGATGIQTIYDLTLGHEKNNMKDDQIEQWAIGFIEGLRQYQQHEQKKSISTIEYTPSVIASAGCTNGMVDVEDMGQVAKKIKQVKKKKLADREVKENRGRPKRMIGLDISTTTKKAAPTTELTTLTPTHVSSSIVF
ncbi:uncharacterized protein BX664DRAFT_382840 [Halteromyces radiatus]|uniref:uncharacterized protein n=1 Tax=Halteromyces radiatus TaxID=101107 RepID=UPI00221EC3B6|nr:uncharacterized protein BX664DRAFT_382840 [Halteromyces radiatus]KAI8096383.1 hypothetical protein BX664DRAFT_382840 [Halteromyces radiatus]